MLFIKEINKDINSNSVGFIDAIVDFVKTKGQEIELESDFDDKLCKMGSCKFIDYLVEEKANRDNENIDTDIKIDKYYDECSNMSLRSAISNYLKLSNIKAITFTVIHEYSKISSEVKEVTIS